jgi:hypothetical protein
VGADSVRSTESVQALWNDYGEIVRLNLSGSKLSSVILKWIDPPSLSKHPHGWNTDKSHQRKLLSYQVEMWWYQHWAYYCKSYCYVPTCFYAGPLGKGQAIVMEDLGTAGFNQQRLSVNKQDLEHCLTWLANFHAWSLQFDPEGLWPVGTYWHLATRENEYDAMKNTRLKNVAVILDKKLTACRFKSLVHGDAKLANFCFSSATQSINMGGVAAVDFQYVGGGCGIKDIVYFLGSCLNEQQCFEKQDELLDFYFTVLTAQVSVIHPTIDTTELESEWRSMYAFASADFARFLDGWRPGHSKLNRYIHFQCDKAFVSLGI